MLLGENRRLLREGRGHQNEKRGCAGGLPFAHAQLPSTPVEILVYDDKQPPCQLIQLNESLFFLFKKYKYLINIQVLGCTFLSSVSYQFIYFDFQFSFFVPSLIKYLRNCLSNKFIYVLNQNEIFYSQNHAKRSLSPSKYSL